MIDETQKALSLDAQALIDALPEATLIVDELGHVECVNRATEKLFGYSRSDLIGKKINFLFSSAENSPLNSSTPSTLPVEVTARAQNGLTFLTRLVSARVDDSAPARFVLSMRLADLLNELQPRALQMTRLAVMGDIAGSISHELNQPLSAIANYAQAVKWMIEAPDQDRAEIAESLAEITKQAIRAGETLRRLRNVIQQGETKREALTLDSVMHEIKVLLATEARLRSVRIAFDLASDLPPVHIDRIQIQQVILSLIRNSVKALENTPREQREIKVRTSLREDGNIEVTVSDTGSGIDVTAQDHIMRRGLGLPMSKTIVEAHDGALVYQPNEPHGARFSFHLPAARGR